MKLFRIFLTFVLVPWALFAAIPTVIDNTELLTYAQECLPHSGILKQTDEGFLYVELPQEYVFDLLPMMQDSDLCPPPYFYAGKVGAHITVASASEMQYIGFPKVPELGKRIFFSIGNFSKVHLEKSGLGEDKDIYMLTVHAPKLNQIRFRLGLPKKGKDFSFHITVAINCDQTE